MVVREFNQVGVTVRQPASLACIQLPRIITLREGRLAGAHQTKRPSQPGARPAGGRQPSRAGRATLAPGCNTTACRPPTVCSGAGQPQPSAMIWLVIGMPCRRPAKWPDNVSQCR
jgi:hypothetical protein